MTDVLGAGLGFAVQCAGDLDFIDGLIMTSDVEQILQGAEFGVAPGPQAVQGEVEGGCPPRAWRSG